MMKYDQYIIRNLLNLIGDRGNPGGDCAKGLPGPRGVPGQRGLPGKS